MDRLDPEYSSLKKASTDKAKSPEERATATESLKNREVELMPTYKQIALLFADLHDRTGRMKAKGCAEPILWVNARRSFYWALRSKLALSKHISHIHHASPHLSHAAAEREIMNLLPSHITSNPGEKDSREMAEALETVDLTEVLHRLRAVHVADAMLQLVRGTSRGRLQALAGVDAKAGLAGLVNMVDSLTTEEKAALAAALTSTQERSPDPPSYAAAA